MIVKAADIARIDHFSELDDVAMKKLINGSEIVRYEADSTILDPASPRRCYSFLIEGRWWMSRKVVGSDTPFEWTDDRPGNWHGGVALFDAVAPAQVKAETACVVLHAPRELLEEIAAQNNHLALAMLRGIQGGATVLFRHATTGNAENAPSGPAKGLTS